MKVKQSIQIATKSLGFKKLRKFQIEPINNILAHRDTMVIAPTSSGKTAIYQIPALINAEDGRWPLVIEPTLSLIADQVNKLQSLGITAEMMTSRNPDDHDAILSQLRENELAILYVTLERLQTSAFRSAVKDNPPWLLVIDEAHCVLDWDPTFRSAYLQIKCFIENLKKRPVVAAFTATAPPEYRTAICELLGMKKPKTYTLSLTRDNIIPLKENCSGLSIKKRLSRVKYNIKKHGKMDRSLFTVRPGRKLYNPDDISLKREAFLKKFNLNRNDSLYEMLLTGYENIEDTTGDYKAKKFPFSGVFTRYAKAKKQIESNVKDSNLQRQMLYLLRKTSDSAGLSAAVQKLKDHYKDVDDRRDRRILSEFDKLGIAPITIPNN